ncbi:Heat shock protein70 [Phytophthora megakarya]|uniref:Heat shock protein70 n=1 Tax=Phytophthora megakarya TaxID=4795 RepID=A0A225WY55_9STRA|nr:Heat shock protein70 [Phytophthora megakarya]
MPKRKHIRPLTWPKLWTKLKKLGWRFQRPKGLSTENRFFTAEGWTKRPNAVHLVDYFDGADEIWKHLPVEVLYEEAPPTKRQTSEPTPPTPLLATSPSKPPVKPPKKAPIKSPAKAAAATPHRSARRTLESASLQLPAAELTHAAATPTELAQALGNSLEGLFFLFLPKSMWLSIATESNRYQLQYRTQAADEIMARQRRIKKRRPEYKMKTLQQVVKEQQAFKAIKLQELVFCALGCCVLFPREDGETLGHGYTRCRVPKGTFGRYMSRKRFEEIVRFLHFSDNYGPDARKYKTWKIKPIADTINTTFKLGMTVGQRIAFDEGMIPMRSKYNPMRQYLRGKPHPWGTKCFLTCDADSGIHLRYCCLVLYRAEIYQGRLNSDSADLSQGPNAVLRNVEEVLEGLPKRRLIITDRFYSSVLLSSILLQHGLYHVGTIQTNRRGYCKTIPYKQAKRPKRLIPYFPFPHQAKHDSRVLDGQSTSAFHHYGL